MRSARSVQFATIAFSSMHLNAIVKLTANTIEIDFGESFFDD